MPADQPITSPENGTSLHSPGAVPAEGGGLIIPDPPDFLARLDRIEARQRAYRMHDPECPTFQTEQAQRHTDMYYAPQPCTCWLTEGTPDAR